MKERFIAVLYRYARVFFIMVLAGLFLALGLMLGYSLIGDGKEVFAIFSLEKWQELLSKFRG